MKINITLELEKNELPIDWRRPLLSLIKSILEKESKELYNQLYSKDSKDSKDSEGNTSMKPFTFWTLLSKSKFENDIIKLENSKINLFISTSDTKLAFYLYNGAKTFKSKFQLPNNNSVKIQNVKLETVKEIKENEILINMLSPLVARNHFPNNQDRYLLFNEDGFFDLFKKCVQTQIGNREVPKIESIKCKKVIVKAYGGKIPASLGIFKLTGDIDVLNDLYVGGLGSKTSAGFGKFEIIG